MAFKIHFVLLIQTSFQSLGYKLLPSCCSQSSCVVILCNAARVANDDSTSSSINSPINSQLLLEFFSKFFIANYGSKSSHTCGWRDYRH